MISKMNVFSVLLLFLGNVCVTVSFKWSSKYPGKLSFKTFVLGFCNFKKCCGYVSLHRRQLIKKSV